MRIVPSRLKMGNDLFSNGWCRQIDHPKIFPNSSDGPWSKSEHHNPICHLFCCNFSSPSFLMLKYFCKVLLYLHFKRKLNTQKRTSSSRLILRFFVKRQLLLHVSPFLLHVSQTLTGYFRIALHLMWATRSGPEFILIFI